MEKAKIVKYIWKLVFILILIVVVMMTLSCASKKDKAHAYFSQNKGELAEFCELEFPSKEVEYIEGDTIVINDTIVSETQIEIPCPDPTPENPKPTVKCPEEKIIIRESVRVDTVRVENTQKIRALQSRNSRLEKQNEDLSDSVSALQKWRLWLLIIALALGVVLIIKK